MTLVDTLSLICGLLVPLAIAGIVLSSAAGQHDLLFGVLLCRRDGAGISTVAKAAAPFWFLKATTFQARQAAWLKADRVHVDYLGGATTSSGAARPVEPDGMRWVTKYFDDRLNVLDAKFNGLLQINGFAIAVLAILSRALGDARTFAYLTKPGWLNDWILGLVSMVLVLVIVMVVIAVFSTGSRLVAVFEHFAKKPDGSFDYDTYFAVHSGLTFERKERVRVARVFSLMAASYALTLTAGMIVINYIAPAMQLDCKTSNITMRQKLIESAEVKCPPNP